jgi:hypothetical protein
MPRRFCFSCGLALVAVLALAAPVSAQNVARERAPVVEESGLSGEHVGEGGFLLPFTQSPQIYSGYTLVKGMAGYDTALGNFVARTAAEARILPVLALRVDFDHGPGMGPSDRFGAGARLQLLRQATSGIDGAIALAYQPNDFRDEGQIVGSVLLGRSFGRFQLFGNVLFGSDPEGDDRAGETRVSALYRIVRQLHLGLDSRFRFNASEDEKRAGTQATDWEFQIAPAASFGIGPVALLGLAGLSMRQSTSPFGTSQQKTRVDAGVVAMAGAGGAF